MQVWRSVDVDLFQRRTYPGICPEIKKSETILGVDQYLPAVDRGRTADQETQAADRKREERRYSDGIEGEFQMADTGEILPAGTFKASAVCDMMGTGEYLRKIDDK